MEHGIVARNLAAQREWYGEPLGDRVRRLVVAYAVSQAQLAEVLGLSPPMLSQLMSGRRAKIGNPAALARMVMLERRVLTPQVASGDPAAIRAVLDEVRRSRPTLGRANLPVEEHGDRTVVPALRRLATPGELAAAAGLLDDEFPVLAELLRRAALSEPPADRAAERTGDADGASDRAAGPDRQAGGPDGGAGVSGHPASTGATPGTDR